MSTLYRVTVDTTRGVAIYGSPWATEVLYCGHERAEARRVYHASTPYDQGGTPGNPARRTILEVIHDAVTDAFADDSCQVE